jgi:hypothetical protein
MRAGSAALVSPSSPSLDALLRDISATVNGLSTSLQRYIVAHTPDER